MSGTRAPLSGVRGPGSAGKGTGHFRLQRVTALANIPLTVFFLSAVVAHAGADYPAVVRFLSHPVVALVMLLFVLSAVWHMRLGLQVVIEDYIHGHAARTLALVLNGFFALCVGAACVLAILKLALA